MSQLPQDTSPLDWGEDGLPRSRLYGDVYYSKQDGLAESRTVFLQGCGLPQAWAGRSRFTVGELGFGTGLNILALLDLWRSQGPAGGQLHIFSIEAHPLSREDARRALAPWPELSEIAAPLLAAWPGKAKGFHRVELPGAVLDLAVMDAVEALRAWQGKADAWFLDGFSPALNPAMWSDQVLSEVAARSAPGARAATFTVAGAVRRGLRAAGFEVEKRPGFGFKRERLEASLPGAPAPSKAPGRVAIIGAGIAGAALARAFYALGAKPMIFDASGPGAGASGNPCALVKPRLDAGLGVSAQLHARAFARAVTLYDAIPGAVIARGALQLEDSPKDLSRFQTIAGSDLFEPGELTLMGADAAAALLGEAASGGLYFENGLTIDPARALAAWQGDVAVGPIARLERVDGLWRLLDIDGRLIATADQVCLATGAAMASLAPTLPVQPVRGQLSWVSDIHPPVAASFGGYFAPMHGELAFGATFDRDDTGVDLRARDDARNLSQLSARFPELAEKVAGRAMQARASLRAAAPDRLPLCGEIEPGLLVLGGLGSHGFTLAPLLAEAVAAKALGAPSPLPARIEKAVDPLRWGRGG